MPSVSPEDDVDVGLLARDDRELELLEVQDQERRRADQAQVERRDRARDQRGRLPARLGRRLDLDRQRERRRPRSGCGPEWRRPARGLRCSTEPDGQRGMSVDQSRRAVTTSGSSSPRASCWSRRRRRRAASSTCSWIRRAMPADLLPLRPGKRVEPARPRGMKPPMAPPMAVRSPDEVGRAGRVGVSRCRSRSTKVSAARS